MEKLNRDANLLEVSVNKYDDLLILDCGDLSVFERFTALYGKIDAIAEETRRELKNTEIKYSDVQTEEINVDFISETLNINIAFSKRVLEELNNVFGAGFSEKVFRESYELNPDFVPDELAITELIEALIPVMEKAYGQRIARNRSKYNAGKRGKHTKTKEELISEYKEMKTHE